MSKRRINQPDAVLVSDAPEMLPTALLDDVFFVRTLWSMCGAAAPSWRDARRIAAWRRTSAMEEQRSMLTSVVGQYSLSRFARSLMRKSYNSIMVWRECL